MAVNISLVNSSNTNNINTNFQRVATALQDVVGRSGSTPNQMNSDFDMNSNDILNVNDIDVQRILVDGIPVDVDGYQGWSPVFSASDYNGTVVMRLVDYVGGTGEKPTEFIGWYVGLFGYVSDISNATGFGSSGVTDGDKGGIVVSGTGSVWSVKTPATRTTLKALDTTTITSVYLKEAGREGQFIWRTGDYTAQVAADTAEGIYIKADAIAASVGAWVRSFDNKVLVSWFGAVGNGTALESDAIQAAIDSMSAIGAGVLEFPAGTYKFDKQVLASGLTNIKIIGTEVTFTSNTTRFLDFFKFTSCTNVRVDGISMDLGQTVLPTYLVGDWPTYYNTGLHFDFCSDIFVTNCKFSNLYTVAVYAYGCGGRFSIRHCEFTSPVQNQDQALQHIHIQTCSAWFDIEHNRLVNAAPVTRANAVCGIFASGITVTGGILIRHNYFEHCGRDNTGSHRLGVIDFYTDVANATIEGNVARQCHAQFARLSNVLDCVVRDNKIHVAGDAEATTGISTESGAITGAPIQQVQNVLIENNVFDDPFNRWATAVGIFSYDWGSPSKNVTVRNNRFNIAIRAVWLVGPFDGVYIEDNKLLGGPCKILAEANGSMTAIIGTEANSVFRNVFVRRNFIRQDGGVGGNAIEFNLTPATTAFIGTARFDENDIETSSGGGTGIYVKLNSSVPASLGVSLIKGNRISRYATSILVTLHAGSTIDNNDVLAYTTAIDPGSVPTVVTQGNRGNYAPI